MYCRNCGTKQDDNASFCNHCGAPLNQPATQEKDTPDKAPKVEPKKKLSKKTWIIIIVSVVVVALLGIMVGVIVHHNKNNETIDDQESSYKYSDGTYNLAGAILDEKDWEDGPYSVIKSGDDYQLLYNDEEVTDDALRPVLIDDLSDKVQVYYFENGILTSFTGLVNDSGFGMCYVTDGVVDVYDNSDDIVLDKRTGKQYYFKYNQWQSAYTGEVDGDLTGNDDLTKSWDIKDGEVIGWTDINGYHSY